MAGELKQFEIATRRIEEILGALAKVRGDDAAAIAACVQDAQALMDHTDALFASCSSSKETFKATPEMRLYFARLEGLREALRQAGDHLRGQQGTLHKEQERLKQVRAWSETVKKTE